MLGVFPNFYVSYTWDAVPLSSGQKFRLALRDSLRSRLLRHPCYRRGHRAIAEQLQRLRPGRIAGYFKRLRSLLRRRLHRQHDRQRDPSIRSFHQDPRYFYKGTGTIRSRALYAISTAFICKGDNGHWQPNYSFILGNFASAGISNLYYPSTDRNGAGLTIGKRPDRHSLRRSLLSPPGIPHQKNLPGHPKEPQSRQRPRHPE